jgi:hypothetical protein
MLIYAVEKREGKIENLELKKSGNLVFTFVSSRVPNSIFFVSFLIFAVNVGSGLSGLGFRNP